MHPFWYHPIVAPPKGYKKWDDLIGAFARHVIDRYGLDEVTQWYFEVWNNLRLKDGEIKLDIPADGIVVLEISKRNN